jgi:hypothetical protein
VVRLTARHELELVGVLGVLGVLGELGGLGVFVVLDPLQLGTVGGVVCGITPTSLSVASERPGTVMSAATASAAPINKRLDMFAFNTTIARM